VRTNGCDPRAHGADQDARWGARPNSLPRAGRRRRVRLGGSRIAMLAGGYAPEVLACWNALLRGAHLAARAV
jgi:hypothetical protein